MFKYPVTTYSGGNKMAGTTRTHKSPDASFTQTRAEESQTAGSRVRETWFQISALPFTS